MSTLHAIDEKPLAMRRPGPGKTGHVIAVSGSSVTAILKPGAEGVRIGSIVRMPTSASDVFGMVTSLRAENAQAEIAPTEKHLAEIQLLGETLRAANGQMGSFQRGVSIHPVLGTDLFAATHDELGIVYARPKAANLRVGTIHQDATLPAFVSTDDLLGKHFAVLGVTGSGKSCSVALILRAVLDQNPGGHVVLLDSHNEYAQAFGDRAELISPTNLQLPYWLLNFEEIVTVFASRTGETMEAEHAVLKAAIVEAKRKFAGPGKELDYVTVDTPVPYRLGDVLRQIDAAMGKLEKPENNAAYLRLKARIEALSNDRRFAFMFSGLTVRDNLIDILSRILRMPVERKPITIFDISGVPSEITDVVVSVLCRTLFDFALWSDRSRAMPILLVCEEAHRYVPRDETQTPGPTGKVVATIAREGRKYGVGLCLVSQRPSELSATILSQCNTLFALRMSNERDCNFVRNALPDSAIGLLEALPALRTREAIVVGEGVTVPMRLSFDELDPQFRPKNGTPPFSHAWAADSASREFIADTIERWRKQLRD
ncbi:ATPase [Hypericibacter adhaerens]|jgi:DNA helicase HerA-like ATPase|uniref:ATPase n=1 Tax=Hypericibacter adhaerens TaxID=2602016 RepID=A0A5J6MUY9_9PROT|nr:ATP-binding protein [Hypericibacter adhaerens]QEX21249.1 ATPase [Hypericibacter adhaerens]HVY50098.1 ATP-binding protein [Devosia sp.]